MSIETDSPVVYHGTSESRFPKKEVETQFAAEFTAQEKDLLRQCNKESFYYRCLPLAIAGMAVTQLAARKGFITPHPKWGTTLSLSGAAFLAWIVGKVSYKSKCEDKFVHLENSRVGEAIRKKRGISLEKYESEYAQTQSYGDDLTFRDDSTFSYTDNNYYPSTGSLNLDTDKFIQYSGLDNQEQPSADMELQLIKEDEAEPVRRFTTYEELRRRNREEYERSQRSYSSRLDLAPPAGQRPWSNSDTTPPRRYSSNLNERETRRNDDANWDNAKIL